MKGKIAKYVTVGTNDLALAKQFYDALFEDLGVTSFGPNDRSYFWTIPGDDTNFAVFVPYDGSEASVGNGSMVGITLETTEDVDALYKKALELGANYLVIGRPITKSRDPLKTLKDINKSLI